MESYSFIHTQEDVAVKFELDVTNGNLYVSCQSNKIIPWYKRLYEAFFFIFDPNNQRFCKVALLHNSSYEDVREVLMRSELAQHGVALRQVVHNRYSGRSSIKRFL